jgi:hypothetical protein
MFGCVILAGFMRIWLRITIAETRHDEGVVYDARVGQERKNGKARTCHLKHETAGTVST